MFARLQEAFAGTTNSKQDGTQPTFLNTQNTYFKSLKHIIPSATSGLPLKGAIQTIDPLGQDYQTPVVPYPNDIFMPTPSLEHTSKALYCSGSTIDQLLAIKNPSATNGCGWMYSPPINGSSSPALSQGFYGDENGPDSNMKHPKYTNWFFNLEEAKRKILMDKCNAMTSCKDLAKDEFSSQCAWCEDRNQGIPVDINGRLLYPSDPMGNCSTESVYTSASKCPVPTSTSQPAILDQSCELINGQLPVACIKKQIRAAGCGDGGTLALALSSATPTNYIENLPSSDALKIYNRHVSPPFNTDIFTLGKTTVDAILREVTTLAGNMQQPATSAIGAASRDLCIQRGALQKYDICNEYSDSASPPFLLECVQKIFLSMGGHGRGTMYPNTSNLTFYNAKGSLGAVRQYVQTLINQTQSTVYTVQRDAMMQLLGITPDELIKRIPYTQGIEVFWFVPTPGVPLKTGNMKPVGGFLKRTIESKIVNLQEGPSRVSQLNGGGYGCMVQLTDVRTPENFKTTFQVTVDDGFFIAVNQPADIDKKAFTRVAADEPGLFQNVRLQGPTLYTSEQPCTFYSTSPNIMKIYFEDAGGGWNALKIRPLNSVAQTMLTPAHFSLTCEKTAPFLTFEVNRFSSEFEELRNPGIFSQFCKFVNLTPFNRTDDRSKVPGKKGFVRLNSASSSMALREIAFQSWKTMTFAVRFNTMPVKATFFSMAAEGAWTGIYCCMVATPAGNGQIKMHFEHRQPRSPNQNTPVSEWLFSLNSWFLFTVVNTESGLNFRAQWLDTVAQSGNTGAPILINLTNGYTFYRANATSKPAPGQPQEMCHIGFGTNDNYEWMPNYVDTNFNYDIAWVHYFDYAATDADIKKDAACEWMYTQFPRSLNSY